MAMACFVLSSTVRSEWYCANDSGWLLVQVSKECVCLLCCKELVVVELTKVCHWTEGLNMEGHQNTHSSYIDMRDKDKERGDIEHCSSLTGRCSRHIDMRRRESSMGTLQGSGMNRCKRITKCHIWKLEMFLLQSMLFCHFLDGRLPLSLWCHQETPPNGVSNLQFNTILVSTFIFPPFTWLVIIQFEQFWFQFLFQIFDLSFLLNSRSQSMVQRVISNGIALSFIIISVHTSGLRFTWYWLYIYCIIHSFIESLDINLIQFSEKSSNSWQSD